ncbi:hypothetical protein [Micromonospora sp. LOL_023]|uniref:hypothetical protein n=1 Tax=Micromonospora sp. LOL_023 TaxID=3345418 RepID=UPI003A8A7A88
MSTSRLRCRGVYTEPDEVAPYADLIGRVWESALSAEESVMLLRGVAGAGR